MDLYPLIPLCPSLDKPVFSSTRPLCRVDTASVKSAPKLIDGWLISMQCHKNSGRYSLWGQRVMPIPRIKRSPPLPGIQCSSRSIPSGRIRFCARRISKISPPSQKSMWSMVPFSSLVQKSFTRLPNHLDAALLRPSRRLGCSSVKRSQNGWKITLSLPP